MWMHLGARVWLDWVDSHSNPADGLSRLGMSDPWTTQQGWALSTAQHPPWPLSHTTPDAQFQLILGHWEGEEGHWGGFPLLAPGV